MDVNPIRRPKPLVAGASASEVSQAVAQCEFPPLLIWDGQGTILLANNALAQLVGQPLSELTGRLLAD
ncbi:MAG TPA: PAS domain-containing protein, partial [Acidimicrobiales bacterium]|nr:PAS domain-containing protein [Acidimicrobiales bacterium]